MKAVTTILALALAIALPAVSLRAAVVECDAQQRTIAGHALTEAKLISKNVAVSLRDGDAATAIKLTTWVGAVNSAQAATVADRLDKISAAAIGVTFKCDNQTPLKRPTYARVLAANAFEIILGTLFWTSPETGFSSKPGTLVHELSHFYLTGHALDPEKGKYGTKPALELARTQPHLAIQNAENIEYFTESVALGELNKIQVNAR